MNSGIRPNFSRSSGSQCLQRLAGLALVGRGDMGAEADRLALQAVGDDLLEAREGAAADEQDVGRVDLQEFLLRMLAAALRRNADAVVPSISLSSACWTPSPDTSRVIDGLSDLRLILSISSM